MKNFFLVCLCLLGTAAIAQEGPIPNNNDVSAAFGKIVAVPNSPEAEAFTQYGEVDANLFNGTPNISIPLYTIAGKELSLPISLTYDASGIKVNQVASNVGLGWNLNVGGRVSRQVRGLPDHGIDNDKSPANASIRQKIVDYKDHQIESNGSMNLVASEFDNASFNQIVTNVIDYYTFMTEVSKGIVDIEQDYFSVNALNLNETLWMDTATYEPHPLKNPNVVIESPTSPASDPLYWVVVDAEGNRYYFGKYIDPNNPPFDMSVHNPIERVKRVGTSDTQQSHNLLVEYNSSWLLTMIESKNKKDIYHFEYTNRSVFSNPEAPEMVNQSTSHPLVAKSGGVVEYAGAGSLPLSNKVSDVRSHYTQEFVQAIYHNGREVVRFGFMDRDDIEATSNTAIKDITIYEDHNASTTPVDRIELAYSYFGNASSTNILEKRLKLDKVIMGINDPENYYSFNYIAPESVPSRDSFDIDLMGYFNGQNNPTPFASWYRGGLLELPGADRDVSPSASKVGTLDRLYYPTGGFTAFEYENHNDGSENYPGLRIKEIRAFSVEGLEESRRTYSYTQFHENYAPILDIDVPSEPSPCSNSSYPANPSTLMRYALPPNMDSGPHISYDEVREYLYDGAQSLGFNRYTFQTGRGEWLASGLPPFEKDFAGGNNVGSPLITEQYADGEIDEEQSVTNGYAQSQAFYTDDAFTIYSNPLKSNSYVQIDKSSGNLSLTTQGGAVCGGFQSPTLGIYSSIPQVDDCPGANMECLPTQGWAALEHRFINVDAYMSHLVSVTKTEHFGGQTTTSTTTNEFDTTYLLLNATETTLETGDIIRNEYTYPQDITNRTAAEDKLYNDNQRTVPILTETTKEFASGGSMAITTQKTEYELFGTGAEQRALPKQQKFAKGGVADLETRIIYEDYDAQGNPLEAYMNNGASVSFIWGYDGQYLVAKIQNRTRSSLDANLVSAVENATASGMASALSNLKGDIDSTGGLMTSYTYEPLIGVSTMMDPMGNIVTYKYDPQNRLQYVLDEDDKVLSENEYHRRSKETLSGGNIYVHDQNNDFTGQYIEFRMDSSITPNGNLLYSWSTENGNSITTPIGGDPKIARVYFDCATLNGDPVEASCLVSDGNEVYQPKKFSMIENPNYCVLDGQMQVTHVSSNVVEFSVINVTGGIGSYSYNWHVGSYLDGLIVATNGNVMSITYNCNQMLDNIKVSCVVEDGAGSSNVFLGQDSPCTIGVSNITYSVNFTEKVVIFEPTVSGGHPDGYIYGWSITSDPSSVVQYGHTIDNVTLPYTDEDGKYYVKYNCTSTDVVLGVNLTVQHMNGSAAGGSFGPAVISGSCIQQ